jgi:hypothetical protein
LYHGDIDLAETYLQLAARWAQQQHPQHQIAALSNLGIVLVLNVLLAALAVISAALPRLQIVYWGHSPHRGCVLQNAGAFSIFKLGTAEHPSSDQYAPAERGLPQLRLQVNSVAASINHRQLLEHPLVKEAMAYWSEALDVISGVTVKTSSVSACPCIFVVVSSKCAIIAAMRQLSHSCDGLIKVSLAALAIAMPLT